MLQSINKTAQTVQSFPEMTATENVLNKRIVQLQEKRNQNRFFSKGTGAFDICRLKQRKV